MEKRDVARQLLADGPRPQSSLLAQWEQQRGRPLWSATQDCPDNLGPLAARGVAALPCTWSQLVDVAGYLVATLLLEAGYIESVPAAPVSADSPVRVEARPGVFVAAVDYAVYASLTDKPVSAWDLARQLGYKVAFNLGRLQRAGLARSTENGWVAA